MSWVIPLGFLVGGLGLLGLMRLWLIRQGVPALAQVAFTLVVLVGALLGVWGSTRLELQVDSNTRVVGLPLPLAVYRRDATGWTREPTPRSARMIAGAANAVVVAATLAGPACLLLGWIRAREGRAGQPGRATSRGT